MSCSFSQSGTQTYNLLDFSTNAFFYATKKKSRYSFFFISTVLSLQHLQQLSSFSITSITYGNCNSQSLGRHFQQFTQTIVNFYNKTLSAVILSPTTLVSIETVSFTHKPSLALSSFVTLLKLFINFLEVLILTVIFYSLDVILYD